LGVHDGRGGFDGSAVVVADESGEVVVEFGDLHRRWCVRPGRQLRVERRGEGLADDASRVGVGLNKPK
jgi:hypothetical protein